MSEFVFILGAGASAHTGAPVMSDFHDAICDLLEAGVLDDQDREAFNLVNEAKGALERILVKVDMNLNNLETIFSLIEMGNLIDIFPGNVPVEKLHKAIQRVIVRTIELKTNCYHKPSTDDAYDLLAKEIKLLWGQRETWRSSILTFNYDVAIDLAIERHLGAIDYSLHEKKDNSRGGYKLLKLHGSFNWAKYVKNNEGGVIPISVKRFVSEYGCRLEDRQDQSFFWGSVIRSMRSSSSTRAISEAEKFRSARTRSRASRMKRSESRSGFRPRRPPSSRSPRPRRTARL